MRHVGWHWRWREGKSRPLPGNSPHDRTGRPGGFSIVKESLRRSLPAIPPATANNPEAPQDAFSKAGRNLSVRCGRRPKPNPGAGATASRWSAPGPGKRTRREDHALLIVRDEFRTGYSSIGLLASRARLRFTGTVRINSGLAGENELSSNGNCVFSFVSHLWGSPHNLRSSVFICGQQ
jgi:hypothetical protein